MLNSVANLRPFFFNYAKNLHMSKNLCTFAPELGASNEPVAICDQL